MRKIYIVILILFIFTSILSSAKASPANISYSLFLNQSYTALYQYNYTCGNDTFYQNLTWPGIVYYNQNYNGSLDPVNFMYTITREGLVMNLTLPSNAGHDVSMWVKNINGSDYYIEASTIDSFEYPEKARFNSSPELFTSFETYLYRNMTYRIPYTLKGFNYSALVNTTFNVTLEIPTLNQTLTAVIHFNDTTPPSITKLIIPTTGKVNDLLRLTYVATDACGIKSAVIGNSTINADIRTIIRGDNIDVVVTPQKYGFLDFNMTVYDFFDNPTIVTESVNIDPACSISLFNLYIPKLKINKAFSRVLYNDVSTEFNVTMHNTRAQFTANAENTTGKEYSVRIGDGSKYYDIYDNVTVQIGNANKLVLEVTGYRFGNLSFDLYVDYPETIRGNKELSFGTSFGDYELFQETQYTVGGATTTCALNQGEDIENSSVDCCIALPYDTDVQETVLIMPRQSFRWYEEKVELDKQQLNDKIRNQSQWKTLFISLFITLLVGVVVYHGQPDIVF